LSGTPHIQHVSDNYFEWTCREHPNEVAITLVRDPKVSERRGQCEVCRRLYISKIIGFGWIRRLR
jgi:hypothetical protein